MTVEELKEQLADVPNDADVRIKHELVGYEHSVESVKYDKKWNVVWIRETA